MNGEFLFSPLRLKAEIIQTRNQRLAGQIQTKSLARLNLHEGRQVVDPAKILKILLTRAANYFLRKILCHQTSRLMRKSKDMSELVNNHSQQKSLIGPKTK